MGPWSGVPRAARARNPTCPSGTKLDLGSDDPVRGAGWTLDELVDAALRADRPLAEATHLATADSTQQANAPATIPTGNIIEATPPPQIIHIFTAVHIVKL
jgi:hypothetical protein